MKSYRIYNYFKYLLFFFLIFYLEPIVIINNYTFSQIWKIPIILFAIFFIISKRYYKKSFSGVSFLYAIKNIFNQSFFKNPTTNFIETFRYLNFFVIYEVVRLSDYTTEKVYKILVIISQYFILSNLPYLFGILKSRKEGLSFGEKLSFIGIFQNPHAASVIISFASILLIYNLKNFKFNRINYIYNFILIFFGFVIIFFAFVRTGYLILFIGLIIVLHPTSRKNIFIHYFFITLITYLIFISINSNTTFKNRIYDLNKYGKQLSIGSGRVDFATISIKYWSTGDFYVLLFGRGLINVKNNLYKKTGMRIFSHNGFVDALAINGVIGFYLFIYLFILIFKLIKYHKDSIYFRINLSFIIMYFIYQITQGGITFGTDLFLALSLNLFNKSI